MNLTQLDLDRLRPALDEAVRQLDGLGSRQGRVRGASFTIAHDAAGRSYTLRAPCVGDTRAVWKAVLGGVLEACRQARVPKDDWAEVALRSALVREDFAAVRRSLQDNVGITVALDLSQRGGVPICATELPDRSGD